MCVCVYVSVCVHVPEFVSMSYGMVRVCRAEENLWESDLSFYHIGPGDQLRSSDLVAGSIKQLFKDISEIFLRFKLTQTLIC